MKIFIQGIIAGVAVLILSLLVSFLSSLIFPGINKEYMNPNIFRPWSDPLMSLYFVYPFVLGVVLSFIWDKTKKLLTETSILKRGAQFGLLYWVVASIPGMFITYSSFQVSLTLVLIWSIGGLVEGITAGIVLAKINK